MKRLLISCFIILLLVGLMGIHVSSLKKLTGDLIDQLETTKTHLANQEWSKASKIVQQVTEQWEQYGFYLHTTLRHTDIDAIRTSIKEITAYLESREDQAECMATTAKLINQLELLLEAELPTIKNLL